MNNNDLLPASPPLSPGLLLSYQVLDDNLKPLFIKVFKYLWGVVHRRRYFAPGDVLLNFWAVNMARRSASLSLSQLAILTYIYQMSNKGKIFIHSDSIYNVDMLPGAKRPAKINAISILIKRGYLFRSCKNTDQPYLKRSYTLHPVFIRLTPAGITLIEGIEKKIYKFLLNTSLNDLTGVNKKP